MKREIKFRAWDGFTKSWHYGNLIDYKSSITIVTTNDKLETFYFDNLFFSGQYTGLKDKNGKEIYEGDILKQDTQIDEVSFNEGHWLILPEGDGLFHYAQDTEVIGNIHENPALLLK